MKTLSCALGIVLGVLVLSTFALSQDRLSPNDQREFDKYYSKWVNDTRKNDRDDIAKDVSHMQEIMSRNNIPADVPFERIASTGDAYDASAYRGRLSGDEQRDFDKYYTKWVNDTRKNDRDDIGQDVRHMQEIMAKKNIPASVSFDRIASSGYSGESNRDSYPAKGSWRNRLSRDDQRDFDAYHARWVEDNRANDRERISRDAGYMQTIMSRNNIPADVPFDQIASAEPYSNGNYRSGDDQSWQGRLSEGDQREFDRSYSDWLEDTRKNDRDDIDRDVRRMQDIMARNNVPANVPFDRIASPDADRRH
jgi:hypothetical protein